MGETIQAALMAAQQEFPEIPKDKENTYFKSKYSTLDAIQKACWPVLHKHGLLPNWILTQDGGRLTVTFILTHTSGEKLENALSASEGANIQEIGKAITYLRRYTAAPLLGITSDEDDDGNAGARPRKGRRPQGRPEQRPQQQPLAQAPPPAPAGPPSLETWKKKLLTKADAAEILAFAQKCTEYQPLREDVALFKEVMLATIEEAYQRSQCGRLTDQEYSLIHQFCNPQIEALQPKTEAPE